jgi:hypothetical protein
MYSLVGKMRILFRNIRWRATKHQKDLIQADSSSDIHATLEAIVDVAFQMKSGGLQ